MTAPVTPDQPEATGVELTDVEVGMASPVEEHPAGTWVYSEKALRLILAARLAGVRDEREVRFEVGKDWPTPNNCRRTAALMDELNPARYGDILRAYADAEDARFEQHGPIRADRLEADR